ncbi:MAG: biopolymer transport protein ExbB [Planctomycetaceae bacterium]|nr:biopolymer transport protein ExbB [Planctomycetaceae bacterium]
MDMNAVFRAAEIIIYAAQAWTALYGVFCVILLLRRIRQKQFSSAARADDFLRQVQEPLSHRKFDDVAAFCDTPPYWAKIVPQLILVAMANRDKELSKIRRLLAEKFERDVLSDFEYRMAWISTMIKTAPMLGLLGTVQGMIAAFTKIASVARESGTDPAQLASDISFALWTTAIGLMTCIPLVMLQSLIHVRIGRLQDAVQQQLGSFMDEFSLVHKTVRRGS